MNILFTKKALELEKELQNKVVKNKIPYPSIPLILFSVLFTIAGMFVSYVVATLVTVGLSAIGIYCFSSLDATSIENILGIASVINVILLIICFVISIRFIPYFSLKLGLKTTDKLINSKQS